MDVAGFNYRPHKYPENYKKLPQQIILGSETASTVVRVVSINSPLSVRL